MAGGPACSLPLKNYRNEHPKSKSLQHKKPANCDNYRCHITAQRGTASDLRDPDLLELAKRLRRVVDDSRYIDDHLELSALDVQAVAEVSVGDEDRAVWIVYRRETGPGLRRV
jgi:hypothetical protein